MGNVGNVNNNNLSNNYLKKMDKDLAEAKALLNKLKAYAGQAERLALMIALFKRAGLDVPSWMYQALSQWNTKIKQVEGKLNKLDPAFQALDHVIADLEHSASTIGSNLDANMDEDFVIFNDIMNKTCEGLLEKYKADLFEKKMQHDGDNNDELLKDALEALKAADAEAGTFGALQDDLCNDLVALNQQENQAKEDLGSYDWLEDAVTFGTDSSEKAHDRAVIRNSEDMKALIVEILKDVAPLISGANNDFFSAVNLEINRLYQELKKILEHGPHITAADEKKIKVLMAIALGILAQIQAAAAQEKSKDHQTEVKATTFSVEMNMENEKAQYVELQEELAKARMLKSIMKYVKPMLEVGGCLLAPGIGSLLVMITMTVLDNTGLTNKLAEKIGGTKGEVIVGALEVAAVLAGGAGLDEIVEQAGAQAADEVAVQVASTTAKVIDEAVQKALTEAGKMGDEEAQAAVEKVVSQAVNNAVKEASENAVKVFSKQASANLVPQLLKTAAKQGARNLMVKASMETALAAAKEAAETAGKDIAFLAEAAADGATISQAEIAAVSKRAATEALANATGSSLGQVEKATADKSAGELALSRAGYTAAYNALSDGLFSYGVEQALLKAGEKSDDASFQHWMTAIKVLEQILASFMVMKGSGVMDSMVLKDSSTFLLKVSAGTTILGTGIQGVTSADQATTGLAEADTVRAITESKVSNDLLNLMLQNFQKQEKIDAQQAANRFSEQASNYTMIANLENNGKELAKVMAASAV